MHYQLDWDYWSQVFDTAETVLLEAELVLWRRTVDFYLSILISKSMHFQCWCWYLCCCHWAPF